MNCDTVVRLAYCTLCSVHFDQFIPLRTWEQLQTNFEASPSDQHHFPIAQPWCFPWYALADVAPSPSGPTSRAHLYSVGKGS